MFCLCFCILEVISLFKSLRAGSQVFALPILFFLCVIFHTMWSDKSRKLMCILPFGMLCLSVHDVRLYSVLDTLVGLFVLCGPSC